MDTGWWVGYLETKTGPYFFATRITKKRTTNNPNFGKCRKEITYSIFKDLGIIE
jgi:beta-lactamase class D